MQISLTGSSARDKAVKGVEYVGKAIRSTMGPFGQNFLLQKGNKSTNDGFLISTELVNAIKDEFERRGALIAQEASAKTNEQVQDATSTAWALTEAILKEGVRFLPSDTRISSKHTASEIINMISTAKEEVLKELEARTTPIVSVEELVKSALVSSEDEHIAKLLGELQWELGPEGVILAEETNDSFSSVEKVNGIRIDSGFGTSMMISNPENQSLELKDTSIFLTNYTISEEQLQLLKESVINPLKNQKKLGLILVARAFTSEAIKFCMESLQTGFPVFPVNAPYTNQTEVMKDIAAVTGARHIDIEASRLEDAHISDVGFAKRFTARLFDAVIAGEENPERTSKRVEELRLKLTGSQSTFDKKMIESRIAQLSNGFGILKVGSPSLANQKRLKDKADDAVGAVRLALKGGTVKGGGLAFKEISDSLPEGNILKRPLTCVYDQITSSAPEGWIIPDWCRDPFLVLKSALENACDVAQVLCNVSGQVVEKNKREPKEDEEY